MNENDGHDNGHHESIEHKAALPPVTLYNKAVLESFQQTCSQHKELLQANPDLVVILGGSFSKGLGHFYSDSDWLFLTESELYPSRSIHYTLVGDTKNTFNNIVRQREEYHDLARYARIGFEIRDRHKEKSQQRQRDDFRKRPELLQRAYHNGIDPQRDTRNFMGVQFNLDAEFKPVTIEQVQDSITTFPNPEKSLNNVSDPLFLTLSGEVGVNAFESTPGTLDTYKARIIDSLKMVKTAGSLRYIYLMDDLQRGYLNFTRQAYYDYGLHNKSPRYVRQVERTEDGEPVLSFYRRFPTFPDKVEDLETYVNRKV